MSEIDLTPFCYTDKNREDLRAPISRGDFTFATDGRILIRIPRRDGVPRSRTAVERVIPDTIPALSPAKLRALPELPEPEENYEECDVCDGTGRDHDCSMCEHECRACGGDGDVAAQTTTIIKITLRGAVFDLRYVRMIAALPNLQLPERTEKFTGMYFRFDGGDGVLMPMRWDGETVPAEESLVES